MSGRTTTDYEALAKQLEQNPNYRVLRKIEPQENFVRSARATRIGAVLDIETTGLNIAQSELLELAILKFRFSDNDEIVDLAEERIWLNEPTDGIPEEITSLTGISQSDVAGQKIDPTEVAAFLDDASVIVAHNAQFDRPIFERYVPECKSLNWACTATEIDWKAAKLSSAKLEHLLIAQGYFYDPHRAIADCRALLQLLTLPLPQSERSVLQVLLSNARRPTFRIFADKAPFETKDLLKARGYRWDDGSRQRYKAWWKDLYQEEYDQEVAFLRQQVFGDAREIPTTKLTAKSRFKAE